MNEQTNHADLIDRLAAGELDDAVRHDLFAWLDREPSRWRRCALALLEARELEQALGAWQTETPRPTVRLPREPAVPMARRSTFFALAAAVLMAFSLGILARGFFAAPAPRVVETPNLAGHKAVSGTAQKEPTDAVVKEKPQPESEQRHTAVAAAPANAGQTDVVPPYVRSQLERRGYHRTSHPAQLPVVFPDGRRGTVPADRFHYVGQRTY